MAKNLIIYYSRKGQNYWNGSIKNIAIGKVPHQQGPQMKMLSYASMLSR